MIMGVRGSKLDKLLGAREFKRLRSSTPPPPPLTPRGYIPVCVGMNNDFRRFVVHTTTLNGDEDLLELLYRSAEEYGFCNEGIMKIPYEANAFEDRILMRRSKRKVFRDKPN
ncbi:auxin-responsive protein SAUR71-like [Carya illinoinensis]|uniref:Uncharacterized protein n=1 Tax=Carya illinoinensis TaxID=32201 RepID=A0A8T1RED9_CARIL|nr:auxin-responsive protein SAUR71-like [Carya illinoinensis]KAG6665005.1 hypothetical protein CIPAW_02G132900 [Carya illinoinensis]KAG6727499.1 hypothetical protein I3842_02G130300 [Carya illinoinensis]